MSEPTIQDFPLPDLGEGLEDATITEWLVAVGDEVALNQLLCTVETNKAEVELPSPYAGRVAELGGAEGETLLVGAVWYGSRPLTRRLVSLFLSAMVPMTRWTAPDDVRGLSRRCASWPQT